MKLSKTLKVALKAIFMKAGKVETDKATLVYDGEGELVEGMEVFVEVADEEGNTEMVVAEDGEYTVEDGTKITVEGGKVSKIEAPVVEEEVEETKEEEMTEELPAEEPVEKEDTEEEKEEDKVKSLEEKVSTLMDTIEKLTNSIAAIEGRLAEAEGKIAAVETEPATEPVVEEAETDTKKSRLSYLRK